ncbi:hypothetical protein E5288_WYG005313 [Bos mutus]|uniref:AP-1 complex subunit sigma-2 n=1 Tax=Bos mutus TaxID=72004 RepID=A0A6B0S911_9CETA|nr:hypothetical protein [Bos mutus]
MWFLEVRTFPAQLSTVNIRHSETLSSPHETDLTAARFREAHSEERRRASPGNSRFRVTWPGFRSGPPLSVETRPIRFLGLRGHLSCLRSRWQQPSCIQRTAQPAPPLAAAPAPPSSGPRGGMQFMLLFSRQGKLRLQKWYVPLSDKEKKKITRELVQTVLARKPKMCSFLEWRDLKIVYKRYASLYFCCAIEDQDNELITLEIIHRYVELLDKYFGSVCELDIIFNFEKAYFILDEFLLGGEVQETSKKNVLKAIEQADLLQEVFYLNQLF